MKPLQPPPPTPQQEKERQSRQPQYNRSHDGPRLINNNAVVPPVRASSLLLRPGCADVTRGASDVQQRRGFTGLHAHGAIVDVQHQQQQERTRHGLYNNVYQAGEKTLSDTTTAGAFIRHRFAPDTGPECCSSKQLHPVAAAAAQHQARQEVQAQTRSQTMRTTARLPECTNGSSSSSSHDDAPTRCLILLQPRHASRTADDEAHSAGSSSCCKRKCSAANRSGSSGGGDGSSSKSSKSRCSGSLSGISDILSRNDSSETRIGSEPTAIARVSTAALAASPRASTASTTSCRIKGPGRKGSSSSSTRTIAGTSWSSSRFTSATQQQQQQQNTHSKEGVGPQRSSAVPAPTAHVQHPSYLRSSSSSSSFGGTSGRGDTYATVVGQLGKQSDAQRAAIALQRAAAAELSAKKHVQPNQSKAVVLFEVMQGTIASPRTELGSAIQLQSQSQQHLHSSHLHLHESGPVSHVRQYPHQLANVVAAAAGLEHEEALSNGGSRDSSGTRGGHDQQKAAVSASIGRPRSTLNAVATHQGILLPARSKALVHQIMSNGPAASTAAVANTLSSDDQILGDENGHDVGTALTTDEKWQHTPATNVHYNAADQQRHTEDMIHSTRSPSRPFPEPMTDYLDSNQRLAGINQPAGLGLTQNVDSGVAAGRNRVFGLSKDLAGPSPDSAYLPAPSVPATASTVATKSHPTGADYSAYDQARASSSKASLSSTNAQQNTLSPASTNGQPALHTLPSQQAAPSSSAQPGASSQFSIEIIAPSFDKRGYPIFAGRGASIRGIVRMKAIRGCQVEIKLGAYISQGAPAAVWDGLALMPPEQGSDHRIFSISEEIALDESMMRTRDGAPPTSTSPDDLIFETPFEVDLPLGISTRFVNGEPTVTAVNLPPSYEVSSESVARERDLLRGTGSLLKSSAASIRSRSSRLTNFAVSSSNLGATVRDAVERGLGETYRIGCFYTMDFVLQRLPDAGTSGQQTRKLFGSKHKNKNTKPTILDSITVPFIFLGEQSTEQPPPLSIPAMLIANSVARPGSFLGDGWQCERASIKWPGRAGRGMKRNVDIEMHMPFPATLHAPSLFPVLIILRPTDARLLDAVPVDFMPFSPTQADDASAWDGGARSGRSHSRQSTVSKANGLQQQSSGTAPTEAKSSNISDQDTEVLQSYDHSGGGGNDAHSITSSATDGFLSRFMRSSLTLARKNSSGHLHASQPTTGLSTSQSSQSIRQAATDAGGSDQSGGSRAPTAGGGGGGHSGVSSLRDAVASKLSRRRPNTAPTSQTSSDGRTRISESTMMGSGGQYTGNLSGLVRVSLVQTTFCISTGPSELPKNLRRLVSMAEVEELDADSLLAMVRQSNGTGGDGAEGAYLDEHDLQLQSALEEQLKDKGVRVLRALFRVGSDATPSFRCQGIELRYGIKVDLVPFSVRRKRPNSGGAASGSSGGPVGSESGGEALRKSRSRSSFSSSVDPLPTTTDSVAPPYSPTTTTTSAADPQSPRPPIMTTQHEPQASSPLQQHAPSPVISSFSRAGAGGGGDGASVTTTGEYASTLRGTVRTSGKAGGGGGVPRSGETTVSTVYADGAQSFDKIEKGVGVLFASVRLVRAAT